MAELAEPPSASSDEDPYTVVCVTCSNERQAAAVEAELEARRRAGTYGDKTLFFAVPDPSAARVGSGGATFNALLTVQELVSSSPRFALERCRTFLIHSGGDSQRLPCQSVCGKAWSALPAYNAEFELDAPIDLLLQAMFSLFRGVRTGLVVASSDVLLLIPRGFPCHWPSVGATGLAIPTDKHTGPNHGVYQVEAAPADGGRDPEARFVRRVSRFFQKASVAEMAAAGAVREADQTVLIDSGVIYFSQPATATLLELARTYPLDCCTYLGLDMNRRPLRIELYSDIMMAMGGGMGLTKEAYHRVATSDPQAARIATSRDIMWAKLLGVPFFACVVEGGHFSHVGTTAELLQLLAAPTDVQRQYGLRSSAAWYEAGRAVTSMGGCVEDAPAAAPAAAPAPTFTALNTLFHGPGGRGAGSVVEHSELAGDWHVGPGSLVSSVRSVPHLIVRDGVAVQELRVFDRSRRVLSVLGVTDPIKDPYTKASARICGATWAEVFAAAGVGPADIWPADCDAASMTIWTARLFPVVPLTQGGGLVGQVDSVTADRAALWLQWLAAPGAGAGASLPAEQLAAVRRAHLHPKVLAAWRTLPRLSLRDFLGEADATVEFAWRRELRGKIDAHLLVGAVDAGAGGANVHVSELVRRLGRGAAPSLPLGAESAAGAAGAGGGFGQGGGLVDQSAFALHALRGLDHVAASSPSAAVAGRALAVQSALLWAMAGWGSHGHRSGPAHNEAWLPAFALLDGGYLSGSAAAAAAAAGAPSDSRMADRAAAVRLMAGLRDQWVHRAHLTGRAARHYERAAQLLTAQCVYTAAVTAPRPLSILAPGAALPPAGAWVVASCPVRIDLAGGWSDTPPVTFEAPAAADLARIAERARARAGGAGAGADEEFLVSLVALAAEGGGMVVNVGVTVGGARPLGARARRTAAGAPGTITIRTRAAAAADAAPSSVLAPSSSAASAAFVAPGEVVSSLTLSATQDLRDFNQPHAEGALVKCALLLLGVVRLHAPADLSAQLAEALGGGAAGGGAALEVETWSLVPHGSGLGTSSILAAAVLAALAGAAGVEYDRASLCHMVLKIEQMLTTGGGWQDQVGGLWPGANVSSCAARLPVAVRVLPVSAAPAAAAQLGAFLGRHLFLVYTGQTRLAKNLLQRVLRQWAMRENSITQTVAELRANAVAMAAALRARDAAGVGAALDAYWEQKKRMAPMAEPPAVTLMLAALRPLIFGASLCGAGGGGFLVGVAREPDALARVEAALRADAALTAAVPGGGWAVMSAGVDDVGLALRVVE